MKNKQFTYVIAPDGCYGNLTPGKKYEATELRELHSKNIGFSITDDRGFIERTLILYDCYPGRGVKWIIPEINQFPKSWTDQQKSECLIKASIVENRGDYVRRLDEPEQSYEGETSSFSTNDFQGRTQQQVEGSYQIASLCFVAVIIIVILAVLFV